jgi:hypothetical protein
MGLLAQESFSQLRIILEDSQNACDGQSFPQRKHPHDGSETVPIPFLSEPFFLAIEICLRKTTEICFIILWRSDGGKAFPESIGVGFPSAVRLAG